MLTFGFPGMPEMDVVQFYEARGCKFDFDVKGDNITSFVTVEQPCPHLEKGKGCKIYRNRPLACRVFDGRENPVTRDRCKLE